MLYIISLTGSRAVASLANATVTPRQGSCGACDYAPKIREVAIADLYIIII